jgi:hypothetical protein
VPSLFCPVACERFLLVLAVTSVACPELRDIQSVS